MKKHILLLVTYLYTQQTKAMIPEFFCAYQACGGKEIMRIALRNYHQNAPKFNYQKKIKMSEVIASLTLLLTPPALSFSYIYYKVSSIIDE